jgi:C-terminal processing protease CtpA/Prc
MFWRRLLTGLLASLLLQVMILPVLAIGEEEDPPPASNDTPVTNGEGGTVVITGEVTYTNPLFMLGTSQPLIILEDQAGFVDRNEYFLIPPQSQVMGQITSDFRVSPFTYSLALPIEPQGSLRDVDNDGQSDVGVMVFAVAYWTNSFGDPFLEERDLSGGGWSTAYASTRVSTNPDTRREIVGGKFVIYAPDHNQGFPSGFGADGKLFTADDPIVSIPFGYTVVNMDTDPFTFDRTPEASIPLLEPETSALDDFSGLSYTAAFDALVEKFSNEYAFTEYRGLDWAALSAAYRPRFVTAEAAGDPVLYALALRDFLWEIPDGHVSMSLGLINDQFQEQTAGGFGMAIRELDDGRVVVNFLLEGAPAAEAGMQLGTEIIAYDGTPISEVLDNTFIWAHQALGTDHTLRLQQLRYATRRPLDTVLEVTFRNPGGEEQTVALTPVQERDSFSFSSFNAGITGLELPVEFEILPSGYGYVSIFSFSDDEFLTVQLWERMIRTFTDAEVPGIIIDMRNNGGGSGFLADQMTAYFFNEENIFVGQTGYYNEDIDDFFFDDRGKERLYLPTEELRYLGPVAVIVAPSCFSACEFFSYNMTINDRAQIVGHYPTGGLGGSVEVFFMPENVAVGMTIGRAVDMNGNIHIEGIGVVPTVDVPVTEETLFAETDVLLAASEQALTDTIRGKIVDAGALSVNMAPGAVSATGMIQPEEGVQYRVSLKANTVVSIYAGDTNDTLDTIIQIYDSTGGRLLVENDNADENSVGSALEGLNVGPTDLEILIIVRLAEGQTGGEFNLRIEAVPDEGE